MRSDLGFLSDNLRIVVTFVLAAVWVVTAAALGLFDVRHPLSSLAIIAIPAALVGFVQLVLDVLHLRRDEDQWPDWRDEPFRDPARDGGPEPVEASAKTRARRRKPSFAKMHRRSLAERTRFWSMHKHAKGSDE